MDKLEIRYAGTGGQGIILLGILTAEAASIAGNYGTQGSFYGAQVRGGITSADVVLSKDWVSFPYVENSDILVALTTESLDHYIPLAKPNSTVIVDELLLIDYDETELKANFNFIKVPFTSKCFEHFNSGFLTNIVVFGYITRFLKDFFSEEEAEEAIRRNVPPKYIEEELKAYRIGLSL